MPNSNNSNNQDLNNPSEDRSQSPMPNNIGNAGGANQGSGGEQQLNQPGDISFTDQQPNSNDTQNQNLAPSQSVADPSQDNLRVDKSTESQLDSPFGGSQGVGGVEADMESSTMQLSEGMDSKDDLQSTQDDNNGSGIPTQLDDGSLELPSLEEASSQKSTVSDSGAESSDIGSNVQILNESLEQGDQSSTTSANNGSSALDSNDMQRVAAGQNQSQVANESVENESVRNNAAPQSGVGNSLNTDLSQSQGVQNQQASDSSGNISQTVGQNQPQVANETVPNNAAPQSGVADSLNTDLSRSQGAQDQQVSDSSGNIPQTALQETNAAQAKQDSVQTNPGQMQPEQATETSPSVGGQRSNQMEMNNQSTVGQQTSNQSVAGTTAPDLSQQTPHANENANINRQPGQVQAGQPGQINSLQQQSQTQLAGNIHNANQGQPSTPTPDNQQQQARSLPAAQLTDQGQPTQQAQQQKSKPQEKSGGSIFAGRSILYVIIAVLLILVIITTTLWLNAQTG